jgi:hypothetical protein
VVSGRGSLRNDSARPPVESTEIRHSGFVNRTRRSSTARLAPAAVSLEKGDMSSSVAIAEPDTAGTADSGAARSLQLPALRVEASPKAPLGSDSARELEPCSNWRDLGPAHVVDGVGLDARRVRDLC